MQQWKTFLLATVLALLSGCVSLYQYRSEGEITTHNGEQRSAVLYWHKDEGRSWYGEKYEEYESDVTLRICNGIPKPFVLGDDGYVELLSKGGEFQVARLDANGALVMIDDPQQIPQGQPCGLVVVNDRPADTARLKQNLAPEVVILCEDRARRDRYPKVASYSFGAVTRAEVDKDTRPAPDPCQ